MFWSNKVSVDMDKSHIDDVLTRGVDEIYPDKETLSKALSSGRRLKLYQGFDPTGTQLHIGHMIGLRKLAQFQALGHEVIFVIGDGTGQAGDPSGKKSGRDHFFNTDELRENAKNYVQQASALMRFRGANKVRVVFNSSWLNTLTLTDLLNIAGNFSLQQLSERNMFAERMKRGEAVNLREFLYPLLQAYDSVALDVDLEIGGTDQTFNMLAGRTLMKKMREKEKFVLTTPLLSDAHGNKIGKSEGNVIGLTDDPKDLYGKIMTLSDDVIASGLEYLTDVSMEEIKIIKQKIESENPKQYKERLAYEVVVQLHGKEEAISAKNAFTQTFSEGKVPDDVTSYKLEETFKKTLVDAGIVASNSEWSRLVSAGAIRNTDTGVVIDDIEATTDHDVILKVGKKRFVRIAV